MLRPTTIEEANGVPAATEIDPLTESVRVTPVRERATAREELVHVIGGGGAAAPLMRKLHRAGFRVSGGIFREGDPDARMAARLDIDAITVSAARAIDRATSRRHRERMAMAHLAVLADLELGPLYKEIIEHAAAR